MYYAIAFVVGACLGGAGIGWVFYNKLDAIKAEAEKRGIKL